MYVLDQYRGTTVSCRYVIPPGLEGVDARTELIDTVEAAIADMVIKHPVLRVAIADADSKKPTWVQLDSLTLSQHIEWRILDRSADFEATQLEILVSQLDGKFPDLGKCPGWRIFVLHQQDTDFVEISFTYNHPHGDGMSGKIFHQSLLQSLDSRGTNAVHSDLDGHILKLPESTPNLPPPIEQVMKLPLDTQFALKSIWQDLRPPILSRNISYANWAPIRTSPYKTQCRAFTIQPDILANVLAACRQHKTTLTGLFHGLALVSLASHLEEEVAPAFQGFTAITLRRFVPEKPPKYPWLVPKDTMGNYVTLESHEFGVPIVKEVRTGLSAGSPGGSLPAEVLDNIWSAAANVRREIEHKLEIGVRNDQVGLMKFVSDWKDQMRNMARKPRQCSWFVTNLGVIEGTPTPDDSGNRDSWSVRRAQFAVSAETTQAALMIATMSVAGERLCVSTSWQECIFDVSLGEHVTADLERWLDQIGSQSG